jgi:outer membrane immunogenic protein
MKKLLLAGTALGGLALAGPALGADLPVKAAPPPLVAPAFTWTGCYIGGNVGGAAGQKEWDNFTGSFFNGLFGGPSIVVTTIVSTVIETIVSGSVATLTIKAPVVGETHLNQITSISDDTHGFLAGGQVGCDYQFTPRLVIGISGDGEWANIRGTDDVTFTTAGFKVRNPFAVEPARLTVPGFLVPGMFASANTKTNWLAAVTARLGYVPWDRWLVYWKGGAAWAGDKYSLSGFQCLDILVAASPTCNAPSTFDFRGKETRFGWTTGVGVEYAFWNGWSARLEYDFYDFGTKHVTFTGCCLLGAFGEGHLGAGDASINQRINVAKFGINYRFGWGKYPAPVVARY